MEDILLYFSCLHEGNWLKIYKSIKNMDKVDCELLKKYKEKISSNYITILSEEYPESLKNVLYPPYVIFYRGNIELLKNELIAVVGARKNSIYGENMTKDIVKDLVKYNYSIISGLARGVDAISHQTCLEENGKTVAVIGSGLDFCYPNSNTYLQKEIIDKGLVISEYPDFVEPKAEHYPLRNRLIAALSKAIVVTEAKIRSGTMITVRYGLEYGKDIFCVPYNAYHESGCNMLIKQGACLIENANDIIREIK